MLIMGIKANYRQRFSGTKITKHRIIQWLAGQSIANRLSRYFRVTKTLLIIGLILEWI